MLERLWKPPLPPSLVEYLFQHVLAGASRCAGVEFLESFAAWQSHFVSPVQALSCCVSAGGVKSLTDSQSYPLRAGQLNIAPRESLQHMLSFSAQAMNRLAGN